MPDEIGKGTKTEPAQAPPEPEVTFQQRLLQERWPLSDDFGKVSIIERPEKDILSLGFKGYADNKKIVLSAPLEKWESVFTDGLALIRQMRADAGRPRT